MAEMSVSSLTTVPHMGPGMREMIPLRLLACSKLPAKFQEGSFKKLSRVRLRALAFPTNARMIPGYPCREMNQCRSETQDRLPKHGCVEERPRPNSTAALEDELTPKMEGLR